jgi:hypothetical protein
MEIQINTNNKWRSPKKEHTKPDTKQTSLESISTTTITPNMKWKKMMIFFNTTKTTQNPPQEFLCPISGSLMSDPVYCLLRPFL